MILEVNKNLRYQFFLCRSCFPVEEANLHVPPEDKFFVSSAKNHLKTKLGSKVSILDVFLFDFERVFIVKSQEGNQLGKLISEAVFFPSVEISSRVVHVCFLERSF